MKKLKTKLTLYSFLLIWLTSGALADIPDLDSSSWAADPNEHGMTPKNYIQAESRALMQDFLDRSGVNQFFHFKDLTQADDHWVVSPNNDTIYSIATVNARDGFTLTLPEVGDRFIAAHILTENHMSPFYLYGGGVYEFSVDDFETDFVVVGIRIGTDASEDDVAVVVNDLQPQYQITGAAPEDDLAPFDLEVLEKVRAAMLVEYSKLPNLFGAMVKSTDQVKDWESFTYITAGGWGLSPDENAMYAPGGPNDSKGGVCYTATFPPVPVEEFFSITVYGPEKYLMSNEDNIVSSNQGLVTNDDGSFDIAFGGEKCRDLATNFASTIEDGWSFLLRAYRPNVQEFRRYEMPEVILHN